MKDKLKEKIEVNEFCFSKKYNRRPMVRMCWLYIAGSLIVVILHNTFFAKRIIGNIKIVETFIYFHIVIIIILSICVMKHLREDEFSLINFRKVLKMMGCIMLFLGMMRSLSLELKIKEFDMCKSQEIHILGEIVDVKPKKDKYTSKIKEIEFLFKVHKSKESIKSDSKLLCNLNVSQFEEGNSKGKLKYGDRKKCYEDLKNSMSIGKRLALTVEKKEIKENGMSNTFDYKKYINSKGILGVCNVLKIRENLGEGEKRGFLSEVKAELWSFFVNTGMKIKDEFSLFLCKNIENTGIIESILFGDKKDLSKKDYEDFQKNGVAPLLATSGLHLGIVYSVINIFLGKRLKIKKSILLFVIIFEYMAMCRFSISIVRSGLMITIGILQKHYRKRYDLITATTIAMLIQVIYCPRYIFATDFQLSYMAVFIIAHLNNICNIFIKRNLRNVILKIFAIPMLLQSIMVPITAYYFNYFSWSGYVANIFLTTVCSVILIGGIVGVIAFTTIKVAISIKIFSVVRLILEEYLGYAARIWSAFMEYISQTFLEINRQTFSNGKYMISLTSPSLVMVLGFYALFFYFVSESFIWKISELRTHCIFSYRKNKESSFTEKVFAWEKFRELFFKQISRAIIKVCIFTVALTISCNEEIEDIFDATRKGEAFNGEKWLILRNFDEKTTLIVKSENHAIDKKILEKLEIFLLKNEKVKISRAILLCKGETIGVYGAYLLKRNKNMEILIDRKKDKFIKKTLEMYNIKYDSLKELDRGNRKKASDKIEHYLTENSKNIKK